MSQKRRKFRVRLTAPRLPDSTHRSTSRPCKANLLIGPDAIVEVVGDQRNEHLHRVERFLDFDLPRLRRLDRVMRHEAGHAELFERIGSLVRNPLETVAVTDEGANAVWLPERQCVGVSRCLS